MGYHQSVNPPLQNRPAHPGMYNPPTHVHHPSMGFQDHSWQQAPYQQHQAQSYPSPYTFRRGSGAMQHNHGSISSPTTSASMTPSMSWNTSSQYDRNAGSPSMSNSFSSYTSYPSQCETSSMTPVRPTYAAMNATAPAFTPRFDSNNRSASFYSDGSSPHFSSTPSILSPSMGKSGPLPRLRRTAPSISLSTLNQPACPPARSPLASRGASPVGSNFSTATNGMPLLNSFGLPINKSRTYKVLLPLEVDELRPEETRKRTIWTRTPLSMEFDIFPAIYDPEHASNVRSKSPHPEETHGQEELPENLEIYLPNDWVTLRQALFEERMAKIGITANYLKSMDVALSEKTHGQPSSPAISPHAKTTPPTHLRSESVFAAPFIPRWLKHTSGNQQQKHVFEKPLSAKTHKTAVSLAEPSGSNGFMRQQPPFGPRELPSSRAASQRFANLFAPITAHEEQAEEDEENPATTQVNMAVAERESSGNSLNVNRPAQSLTLEELSAGFGVISEADTDSKPPLPTVSLSHGDVLKPSPPRERIAIEGVTGHTSLPESASLDGDMENNGNHLAITREARKSVSAPDLHERLVEQMQLNVVNDDQQSLDETLGEESDMESYIGTEYSNPSDEERARVRRDQGLPTSALSPAAKLHNLDSWLDPGHPKRGSKNASAYVSPASPRFSSREKRYIANSIQDSPSLKTAQNASGARVTELRPKGLTGTLNAAAPPFVLGFKLRAHNPESASVSSAISRDKAEDNAMGNITTSFPAKSSFSASESRFSFARKPTLNVSAPEFKLRHSKVPLDGAPHLANKDLPPSSNLLAGHTVSGISTLNDAKSAVNNWLCDLAGSEEVVEVDRAQMETAEVPSIQTDGKSLDNVRSFKFPASSRSKPSLDLQALSVVAPQLPPFGTIGRNTFKTVLENFSLESHDDRRPLAMSQRKKTPSTAGQRLPIPDFGSNTVKHEHPASSRDSGIPWSPSKHSLEAKSSADATSSLESSQTWPPQNRRALTSMSKDGICEDLSQQQSASCAKSSTDSSGSGNEEQLWTAMQENRRLIESLVQMQDVASEGLQHQVRHLPATSNAIHPRLSSSEMKALTANIVEAVSENMATRLSTDMLSAQLVQALQDSLARLARPERETLLAPPSGSAPPETSSKIYFDPHIVTQAVKKGMSEAVSSFMDALIPLYIPVPSSPNLDRVQVGDQAEELELGNTLKRILLTLQDKEATYAQSLALEKILSQVTSNCKELQLECDRLRMLEEARRNEHSGELIELRSIIGSKDKQIERLREELLNRATMIDQDTKEREARYVEERTDSKVLRKGLETELAMLKQGVIDEKKLVTDLKRELDEARKRIVELDSQGRMDSALYAERDAVYNERSAVFVQREQEHTTQMSIMQDILGKEAANRVQLEDRVHTAHEETTRLRLQLAEIQAQLYETQVSEVTLSAKLNAAEKTIAEERQIFDRRERQFEQVLSSIQHSSGQHAEIARHAHRTMLETIFAVNQASKSLERGGDLVFETYFDDDSYITVDEQCA